MYCTTCGNVVTAGAPMCPHCHASLAPAPAAANPAYGAPMPAAWPGTPATPVYAPPAPAPALGIPGGPRVPTGFFKSLFDASFSKLVTPSLLRVFWVIFLVVWSLNSALWFIFGFAMMVNTPVMILFSLIVVPVIYLIGIIFYRIAFEFIAAFFRMADDIRDLRGAGGR